MEHTFSRGPPHLADVRPSLWRPPIGTCPKSGRLVEHWIDDRLESATTRSNLGLKMYARRPIWMWLSEWALPNPGDRSELAQIFNYTNSSGPLSKCDLMLKSHLEMGPAEFVEMKLWTSSKSSPGFEKALCDSHIQIECLAYIFRPEVGSGPSDLWWNPAGCRPNALPICRISSWPRAVNAISSAGHLRGGAGPDWMHVPWESSYFWVGFGRGAREVQNRWNSSLLFNSTWKCERSERFLNFDRGPIPVPARVYRFLAGFASFPSHPGYFCYSL